MKQINRNYLFINAEMEIYSDFEDDKNTGHLKYDRMFGILGLIVLPIACINFINQNTARAEKEQNE